MSAEHPNLGLAGLVSIIVVFNTCNHTTGRRTRAIAKIVGVQGMQVGFMEHAPLSPRGNAAIKARLRRTRHFEQAMAAALPAGCTWLLRRSGTLLLTFILILINYPHQNKTG